MMLISLFCVIKLNFFVSVKILVKRVQRPKTLASTCLLNFPCNVFFFFIIGSSCQIFQLDDSLYVTC